MALDLSNQQLEQVEDQNSTPFMKNNFIHQIPSFSPKQRVDLISLKIKRSKISEIKHLDVLVNLEYLNLSENEIEVIENLQELKKLRVLHLEMNKISKIEGLDKLVCLKHLYLSYNRIEVIENLDNLTELTRLDLSFNGIQRIQNLECQTKLKMLNINNNEVTTLDHSFQLKNLRKLYWGYNRVKTLNIPIYKNKNTGQTLTVFPKLEFLSLKGNEITNLQELEKLRVFKRLYELRMTGNVPLTNVCNSSFEQIFKFLDILPAVSIIDGFQRPAVIMSDNENDTDMSSKHTVLDTSNGILDTDWDEDGENDRMMDIDGDNENAGDE